MQREKMLIRGIVSLLILDILLESELYGYAIRKKLLEEIKEPIPNGYIYVILKHLERKNCVRSRLKKSNKRIVRVYTITEDGKRLLFEHKNSLEKMIIISRKILTDIRKYR